MPIDPEMTPNRDMLSLRVASFEIAGMPMRREWPSGDVWSFEFSLSLVRSIHRGTAPFRTDRLPPGVPSGEASIINCSRLPTHYKPCEDCIEHLQPTSADEAIDRLGRPMPGRALACDKGYLSY